MKMNEAQKARYDAMLAEIKVADRIWKEYVWSDYGSLEAYVNQSREVTRRARMFVESMGDKELE
jgi:hypothetical protein